MDDCNNVRPNSALGDLTPTKFANLPTAVLADHKGAVRCATPAVPRPAPLLHRKRVAEAVQVLKLPRRPIPWLGKQCFKSLKYIVFKSFVGNEYEVVGVSN